MLKNTSLLFLILLLSRFAVGQTNTTTMGKVAFTFSIDDGEPRYAVSYNGQVFIKPSKLGFNLLEVGALYKGFELLAIDSSVVDENWTPVWGDESSIRNHYKEKYYSLKHKPTNRLMGVRFRIFAEGVGFRYEFPLWNGSKYFIITDELTQFNLTADHKAFWIPGDFDTNEYQYTTSKLSEVDNTSIYKSSTDIAVRTIIDPKAVQTPLMLVGNNGLYINIHEAALVDYPAMQLHVDNSNYSLTASLVPDAYNNKAYVRLPFHTPWRTIIVSNKAEDILASRLVLNLNEPSKIEEVGWIKPTKFVGVWWELQSSKSSWNYTDNPDVLDANGNLIPNGRHGANTPNVKRYIDFAAKNGIGGVLVEGWNQGWEDWFGNWKENVFDFVTPYPDFDVKELHSYAASKGVKLIMHNETSGSATNYERHLDTAFRFMKENGYDAVKTGYVGKIIPRGEHHDGQWMNNHYIRVAEKAAHYKVMVDMHEPSRPTGLHRTYPNWLANEASRGNEYHAFSNGNAVDHLTILPFTRLMGGPMDYTPGIFKMKNFVKDHPERQINSTLAAQLALYVVFSSPLQMAADLPENYEAKPDAFQFIKDVPVDWSESKVLKAEPGDYVVVARKGKGTNDWFLGAVNDETPRSFNIDLSFLDKNKKYEATIYADATHADWKSNPEAYRIFKKTVTQKKQLPINLKSGGGVAISIKLMEDDVK